MRAIVILACLVGCTFLVEGPPGISGEATNPTGTDSLSPTEASEYELAVRRFGFLLFALEEFGVAYKRYPSGSWQPVRDLEEILEFLPEQHLARVSYDPWCGEIFYWSDGDFYILVSAGPDQVLQIEYPHAEEESGAISKKEIVAGLCADETRSYDVVGYWGSSVKFCGGPSATKRRSHKERNGQQGEQSSAR